jgi:kinesin family protein 11
LSTLDYAYRARNITNSNRPKINQMLSKREVLKGYSDEMDRLRRELLTCRDKNGVYFAKENYHKMLEKIEQQQKDITAKAQKMGALNKEMDKK